MEQVQELQPESAVSIIDTDIEAEVVPSLEAEQYLARVEEEARREAERLAALRAEQERLAAEAAEAARRAEEEEVGAHVVGAAVQGV